VSDGTTPGTHRVKDIFPGPEASYPLLLTAVGNEVFFNAKRQIGGPSELWKSDGTEAGTVLVDGQAGGKRANLGNTLFFERGDAIEGLRLWKSDGTPEGTVPVATIAPPEVEEGLEDLIVVNGKLYFTADDGVHGRELWCYDPALNVAFMVADIRPGPNTGGPRMLTNVGSLLYFQQWTAQNGTELWAFDTREQVIPTVSTWGAVVLLAILLIAGSLILKRNRCVIIA